jgi:hypothetical protein
MAARNNNNNNTRGPSGRKIDPLLPYSIISEKTKKPRLRMRSLLGPCHARRVFTWLLGIAFLITLIFVKSRNSGYSVGKMSGTKTQQPIATATVVNTQGETVVMLTGDMDGDGKLETVPEGEYVTADEKKEVAAQLEKMPWLRFPQYVGRTCFMNALLLTPSLALTVTFMVFAPLSARLLLSPNILTSPTRLLCPLLP